MAHFDNEPAEEDPRVTAYALGELHGAERAEFEAVLQCNPALQREVADIQAAGALLSEELQAEKAPRLSTQRRSLIDAEVNKAVALSKTLSARQVRRSHWSALSKISVAAAILVCAGMLWLSASKSLENKRVADTQALIRRLHEAITRYSADHHRLPPDTGFGLLPNDGDGGAGRTYDAGSLWRCLGRETQKDGKTYGPYIQFSPAELVAYQDPIKGPSFYVVDPWGTPIGYVGDSRRVVHNQGAFDLFSAGPDRKTGKDDISSATNLAYDGMDNNGDGVVDNAAELGAARMNGAMTVASNAARGHGDRLDDVNNWDE